MQNNFWKWVLHTVVSGALVGIPLLLQVHPAWLDLTISGAIVALYNYLITVSGATVAFSSRN